MRKFHFDVHCFFDFWNRLFFLNGFPNPFIVHPRPNFVFESNFSFSLVFFFVHMRHFDIDFPFFNLFDLIFLEMVFPIHS